MEDYQLFNPICRDFYLNVLGLSCDDVSNAFKNLTEKSKPPIDPNALQLIPLELDEKYLNKWNERSMDFLQLVKDGKRVNGSVYRVGGFGTKDIQDKDYFILLKYVEERYDAKILKTTGSKNGRHLASYECIINKNGVVNCKH